MMWIEIVSSEKLKTLGTSTHTSYVVRSDGGNSLIQGSDIMTEPLDHATVRRPIGVKIAICSRAQIWTTHDRDVHGRFLAVEGC